MPFSTDRRATVNRYSGSGKRVEGDALVADIEAMNLNPCECTLIERTAEPAAPWTREEDI